ncbi:redoxin domain-containing protein [Cellvibrio sp. NN19]|uniref:redoxin domain-containing protein n=1 Tax=Cellvibrio chitinivorans TaxID=3102792 RepID=UPI002B413CC6|nr:redoxin domain-containing protein [Cellvibrio sp. NN19]
MRKPSNTKLTTGNMIPMQIWQDTYGHDVTIPCSTGLTHLQFRRYSGCAVCNLHLQSFIGRQQELRNAGIYDVVIFNSTRERILADIAKSPFPIIADTDKHLYKKFEVETSPLAVFNPSVWLPAIKGALKFGVQLPRDQETMNGLPADFLIDSDGKIIAAHYGKHAYDQWSIEELLKLVELHKINSAFIKHNKEELAA